MFYLKSFIKLTFIFLASVFSAQVCPKLTVTDTLGKESAQIDCSYPFTNNSCIKLHARYPILKSTSDYSVAATSYSPVGSYNSGTAVALADDQFSQVIPLPFQFCFYGKSYRSLIISSNGYISFDVSKAGGTSSPTTPAALETPDQKNLPLNSIFGVMHDLIFDNNATSGIYYNTITVGGCRKFVIGFYNGKMVGCTDRATSQIVLTEGTNEIEVFVESKPAPCSTIKFKESLIGILNADGTLGRAAPNRNTGVWVANREGYRFSPSGFDIKPVISWYDTAGNPIGQGDDNTVCPQSAGSYTAKAIYKGCEDYVLEGKFNYDYDVNYPAVADYTASFCSVPPKKVTLAAYQNSLAPQQNIPQITFKYYDTPETAIAGGTGISADQTLEGNKTFYVRAENKNNRNCYKIAKLNFAFLALINPKVPLEICDEENDGIEKGYVLSKFNSKLFPGYPSATVNFYANQGDADSGTNEITTADLTSTTKIFVKFSTNGCSQVYGPIDISLNPVPAVNQNLTFSDTLCDINADGVEPFNYHDYFDVKITSSPRVIIRYYATKAEAEAGLDNEFKQISNQVKTVYVRVEYSGGCYTIAEIKMDITFRKIDVKRADLYLCLDSSQTYSFDLNSLSQDLLISPNPDGHIHGPKFYSTEEDANKDQNQILPAQLYTPAEGINTKVYYVRFEISPSCYTVRPITIHFVIPKPLKDHLFVCDSGNDGSETIVLSDYTPQIAAAGVTAAYFSDVEGMAPVTSLQVLAGNTAVVYVQLQENGCKKIEPVSFELAAKPVVKEEYTVDITKACNNNNIGQTFYDATQLSTILYSGTDAVSYSFFDRYDTATGALSGPIADPENVAVYTSRVIYAVAKNKRTGCMGVTKVTINVNYLAAVILHSATLYECSLNFNAGLTFVLTRSREQVFKQQENTLDINNLKITYYKTLADATAGINMMSSTIVVTASATEEYFVRYQTADGCFSTARIILQSKLPVKALNHTIEDVCDYNLDGIYDVDLTEYQQYLTASPHSSDRITFHLTKGDALNNINPITDPTHFHPAPGQTIWFRAQNTPTCFDVNFIEFKFRQKVSVHDIVMDRICDQLNDGKEVIDLTQMETEIVARGANATFQYFETLSDLYTDKKIKNPEAYPFDNTKNTDAKIYVKTTVPQLCPNKSTINIILNKTPFVAMHDYYFCPNSGTVDIEPDFSGLDLKSVIWTAPDGTTSQGTTLKDVRIAGEYRLELKNAAGCTYSTKFNVKTYEVPVVKNLSASGTTFTVNATGSKKILYSIDRQIWQENNVFSNLPTGITIFYLKFEGSDCIVEKRGLVLSVPNVVTPNADGINDNWVVKDLSAFDGEKSSVKIVDRQGNLVFSQEDDLEFRWNGYWLGRPAPTGTYWYIITLPDGRTFNGWILVKNRN